MSYEGYRELLCTNWHYATCDAYEDIPPACGFCGSPIAFVCSVDCTNGEDEGIPESMPGPKRQIGSEDDWAIDHYGNKYAKLVWRYEPISSRWRKVLSPNAALDDSTE